VFKHSQAELKNLMNSGGKEYFSQRMNDNGIDINKHSESWIAQQLLHHPVSTIDQYFFGEKAE